MKNLSRYLNLLYGKKVLIFLDEYGTPMFSNMFKGWFAPVASNYNDFIRALLDGNVKAMNVYMNDVTLATFSNFDSGKIVSERIQPERFYHGFVLGLLVEIRDRYNGRSNRKSGFGRYDFRKNAGRYSKIHPCSDHREKI